MNIDRPCFKKRTEYEYTINEMKTTIPGDWSTGVSRVEGCPPGDSLSGVLMKN